MLNLPNAPTNPVDATVPMGAVIETPLTDATAPLGNIPAMETKLAATTISPAPNVASANTPHVAGETTNVVPYLLDNVGLDAVSTTILPIPREGGLENDMGKSFLATSFMLIVFDDWLSKTSSLTASMINNEIPTLIGRGSKRCSSMQDDNMLKKPRRPPPQFFQRLELG
ncbi:hypothetical protein V6N12_018689 [Hibiscus sabdariffa]|uniref:Uncharacterized protein n=1 Tax=Hibiscus sabdariffa TaxID=183260 RepID=A0ABR2AKW3_9ROSI